MTDRFEPRSDSSMPGDGGMPTGDNRPGIPRELLAEQWRTAPLRCNTYSAGVTQDGLAYPEGKRLIIAGEQVMDTCETPWCIATIDSVFEGMANGHAVRVLTQWMACGQG
ncbi:hypothetical protein HYS29_00585 [Candidatus Microgenomates bacterium]|nr:hypothetical protein [Candidatus Microgenomates bacterium]